MRQSLLKRLPTTATHFLVRDCAFRGNSLKRAESGRRLAKRPPYMLAMIGLILLGVLSLAPVMAQEPVLTAPTDLSASVGADGVTLTWTAPAGAIDGYEIVRRRPLQDETELTTLVENTGSSETSYTDTSATTVGERYIYRVKAIRGDQRSAMSPLLEVDIVSASCEIVVGDNHDILQCTADAGEQTITSALWTPSFEAQYAQTTSRPSATWVIADEFCGQSTTVVVEASIGDRTAPTVEATITLECSPAPVDSLGVSCENLVENSQHKLRCALSGGDQTIDSAEWTPGFDAESAQTTEGDDAAEATWVISAEHCGQTTSVSVAPVAGETSLTAVETTIPLSCLIIVDDNCSLANAIREANGNAQIEESGDSDGNDDCEAGADPDDTVTPVETDDDIILLKRNVTLTSALPDITSPIHVEGNNHTISGDDNLRVFTVVEGDLIVKDLTITKGQASTVGGGIYINSGSLGLSDSAIKDSEANDIGGGIYAIDSDVDIADTTFSGNTTVKGHGGAVYFISSTGLNTLDIVGATFKKNVSTEDGGALKTAGGIASIHKSTFVENSADEGGAIESSETTLNITNSTFSNNSAREGGGLSSFSSFVTLTHTTWAFNSADEQGGGIAIIGWTGNFKIRNTLITDSKNGGDCHSGPNPDIIVEFAGNFIQDGSCTPQTAESQAAPSDVAVAQAQAVEVEVEVEVAEAQTVIVAEAQFSRGDAMISGLTGNPPHHPLRWGSPAIDNADPMYCLLDDQPFTDRPQYGNCDIGAYEYPKPPPPPASPDPPDEPDPPDPPDPPEVQDAPDPTPQPDPPPEAPTPFICPASDRILVRSPHDDMQCEEIDTITLDKHPALQGARRAMRLWRSSQVCTHTVADGDNLFRLAIQYDTTVEVLKRHNNLANNQLSVGQQLLLPTCEADDLQFAPGTEVCFVDQGSIVYIDTASAERPVHTVDAHVSDGMTCGQISRPGIVVLVAGGASA